MAPGEDRALRLAKRNRLTLRNEIFRQLQDMDGQIAAMVSDAEFLAAIEMLHTRMAELKEVESQVLAACAEEDVEGLSDESVQFGREAALRTSRMKAAMAIRAQGTPAPAPVAPVDQQQALMGQGMPTVKLPTLDIPKYGGDPLTWREFWDSFRSTIHENDRLSNIQKFKYLKQYLKDEALDLAEGYPLSNDTYQQVVDVLTERFGDEELSIFAHLDAMHSLPKATNDLDDIRKVLDKCEMHIRCLSALGKGEESYGWFYTPLLLSKMPPYIRVEMYRRNGSRKWTLPDLRKLPA